MDAAATVVGTEHGEALLAALREAVSEAKADDPLAPVTVLAPNNIAGIAARRHLAQGVAGRDGVAGITVTTLPRLAEQLAGPALLGCRPISSAGLAATVRTVLADEPGVFDEVADNANTIDALCAAHRTLRDLDTTDDAERLGEVIAAASALSAEVVRVSRSVTKMLGDGWYDTTEVLTAAVEALNSGSVGVAELGRVIVHAPGDLSNAEIRLIRALGDRTELTYLLPFSGTRADTRTAEVLAACGVDTSPPVLQPPVADALIHAADPDDEVRAVVRHIVDDLAAPAGSAGHDIAVFYSSRVPYARLLHEQLAAAGIPVNGPGTRPVAQRAVAGFLDRLLALPETGFARPEVLTTLSMLTVRDFAGQPVRAVSWDRISRRAGVVGGTDQWDERLAEFAAARRRQAEAIADDDPQRAGYVADQAAAAESLRGFVLELARRLAEAAGSSGWRELCERVADLLGDLLGDSRLPAEERAALAGIQLALDRIAVIQDVAPAGAPAAAASLPLLRETLRAELETALPRVGRFGEGVFVGPLSAAVGTAVDRAYVVGLSEDLLPGRLGDDPLLPDAVRSRLDGALPLQVDRIGELHRQLVAALAAGRHVTAAFSRGDLRSSAERLPSRWLLPTLSALSVGGRRVLATKWLEFDYRNTEAAESFARSLARSGRPATEQEWRIRQAAARRPLHDSVVAAAIELIRARNSDEFTRFDGNLSGVEGLPDLTAEDSVVAPTTLEDYTDCPHGYFLRRLLGVRELTEPGEDIEIAPTTLGTLVHESVDRFIQDLKQAGDLPGPGEPWGPERRAGLLECFTETAAEFAATDQVGHPTLWERVRGEISRDLMAYLDADDAWRAEHGIAVHDSELRFGLPDGGPPAEVRIDDDRVVRMRGSADRIDLGADGTLYVTDIKTGGNSRFAGISAAEPTAGGTKLQLPVYAYAARAALERSEAPTTARYQFIHRVKGVLELPLTEEVERRYARDLAIIVDGIATGIFPARPPKDDDFSYIQCIYCNPDGIGYRAGRERWVRKQAAAELIDYHRLLEGHAEAAQTEGEQA